MDNELELMAVNRRQNLDGRCGSCHWCSLSQDVTRPEGVVRDPQSKLFGSRSEFRVCEILGV